MLRNYIRASIRHFLRFKLYSLTNIGGFTAGLAVSMFIVLWVVGELRFDRFHSEHVYRVMNNYKYSDGSITTGYLTQSPLAQAMMDEMEEVESAIRVTRSYEALFQQGENYIKESGYYADEDFFHVFTFPIVAGNKQKPLPDIKSIAISHALAQKLFQQENAIGKTIQIDRTQLFTVTSVFENPPVNSSMQFNYVIPFDVFLKENAWLEGWNNNSIYTYTRLKEGSSILNVNAKLNDVFKNHCPTCDNTSFLFPYSDFRLYGRFENGIASGGRIEYVKLFSAVALVILIMSCVNFTILSTAQATTRLKEVSVRKVTGASRWGLIKQFIGESILLSFIGFIVASGIVLLAIPFFNELTGQQIQFGGDVDILLLFVSITLVTGIAAGSYPSLYLSRLQPVAIMKGAKTAGAKLGGFPRTLVVTQLVLSSVLIIGSFIVHDQLEYIQSKELGFQKENIVVVTLSDNLLKNPDAFKTAVQNIPGVESVGLANYQPFNITRFWNNISWTGKNEKDRANFYVLAGDEGFIPATGITIAEGRNFNGGAEDSSSYIINEAAATLMNLKNPVGEVLRNGSGEGKIIGVMKDFHNTDLRNEINPMIMIYSPANRLAFVKLSSDNVQASVSQLKEVYGKIDPGYPFEHTFMQENFNNQYKIEQATQNLSVLFAIISTFISSLGLFGVVLFIAERRLREISIRKVMGATANNIVFLLTRQFASLILTGILIAVPIAWYVMSEWLLKFTYRIEPGWQAFIAAAGLSMFIALSIVAYQTIKISFTNPVESLRKE